MPPVMYNVRFLNSLGEIVKSAQIELTHPFPDEMDGYRYIGTSEGYVYYRHEPV